MAASPYDTLLTGWRRRTVTSKPHVQMRLRDDADNKGADELWLGVFLPADAQTPSTFVPIVIRY